MENLAVAREMEKSGKDAGTIKAATGWERGA
ncbi:LPD23 domain-containing protein, partial [Phocaeicola vulgatus]